MTQLPATPPTQRIAGFSAYLREHGLTIGVAEQHDMLQVADYFGSIQEELIEAAWRSITCHSYREWQLWPDLYARFWHPEQVQGTVKVTGQTRSSRTLRQSVQSLHEQMDSASSSNSKNSASQASGDSPACDQEINQEALNRSQGGASRTEPLHQRDGQMWMPQDLTKLQQIARKITLNLKPRATRRWIADPHGKKLDLRQTMRKSVGWGGEFLQPAWQVKRQIPPRLFILADVSRSMESHAALFLRVARAFAMESKARVFVFHTRIVEVTPYMLRDTPTIQEKVNAVTAGFGGGTRISASIQEFARKHARSQLNRGSRVWVFSDGFDTDEPSLLQTALHEVCSRGAKVTWFHPTQSVPASMALKLAQKNIDGFVPLASLSDLVKARNLLH